MTDLSPGTMVQVTNKGNRPFSIQWNGRVIPLQPSKPQYVPAEAAILWFGDPRATTNAVSYKLDDGNVVVVPDRDSEIRRLCVKYGYVTGGEIEFLTKEGDQENNAVPQVEVVTLDDEKKVLPTILSDPRGDEVTPQIPTVAENNDLRAMIDAQSKQIEALKKHIGIQPSTVELGESDELPEDDSHLRGDGPQVNTEPPELTL